MRQHSMIEWLHLALRRETFKCPVVVVRFAIRDEVKHKLLTYVLAPRDRR